MSGSQCTWLQTKDRAALSQQYVDDFSLFLTLYESCLIFSYVQELEARLLDMESLFSQIAPVLEQIGPSANIVASSVPTSAATIVSEAPAPPTSNFPSFIPNVPSSEPDSNPSLGDDFRESCGQLALDEYGHMRWIGSSSTMSLIQSFRALTLSPSHRVSLLEEDLHAPVPSVNKLYFPAAVFFGKVHALPVPEEVEYPERDLADKLVSDRPSHFVLDAEHFQVEAYFARFHFLMPVIDKPSFLRRYENIMDNTHDHVLVRNETAFLSLLFAVFACAAHLDDDPRLTTSERHDDGGMGMVYYELYVCLDS